MDNCMGQYFPASCNDAIQAHGRTPSLNPLIVKEYPTVVRGRLFFLNLPRAADWERSGSFAKRT